MESPSAIHSSAIIHYAVINYAAIHYAVINYAAIHYADVNYAESITRMSSTLNNHGSHKKRPLPEPLYP